MSRSELGAVFHTRVGTPRMSTSTISNGPPGPVSDCSSSVIAVGMAASPSPEDRRSQRTDMTVKNERPYTARRERQADGGEGAGRAGAHPQHAQPRRAHAE